MSHGTKRKAEILHIGIHLWRNDAATCNAGRIAEAMGLGSHAAVLYHFGNAAGLRHAIAVEAVRLGDAVIVPQLIVAGHEAAASLSGAERRRYLNAV